MFELKFYSSVLDKMPVGTSFRDSEHEVSKRVGGWKCEDCSRPDLESSSSALMSDTSQGYALEKFAGAVIDPDDLDPRLLAFLPVGTRVADCDTQLNDEWHWHKTKAGLWVWDESREGAETAASNGVGVGDLSALVHLLPFRLRSVGTDEAESDGTPADSARSHDIDELNLIDNKILLDDDGDRWIRVGNQWYILYSNGIGGLPWGDHLNPSYGPYEIAEEFQEITERQAETLKGKVLVDREGDLWAFVDGSWSFKSGAGFVKLGGEDPFGSYGPLTLYHDQSIYPEPSEAPEVESAPEPETEKIPEGKTRFTASEATNFKDCRFRDRDGDVWLFDEEAQRWRFLHSDGTLSVLSQYEKLSPALEPFILVEGEIKTEPETETKSESEPAEGTKLSAKEASVHKGTVFEDSDGDEWFFDDVLQRWRGIGPDWAYSKEELEPLFSPYTKVGPLSEYERGWTAGEANEFKDEALEDRGGDTWIYDAPSEMWKCSHSSALDYDELDEAFQPYRIKKAAQGRPAAPEAIVLGFDEPFQLSGDTEEPSPEAEASEEVTFEGSAKEAVELLDRIARSLESISRHLESIDNNLGDK